MHALGRLALCTFASAPWHRKVLRTQRVRGDGSGVPGKESGKERTRGKQRERQGEALLQNGDEDVLRIK